MPGRSFPLWRHKGRLRYLLSAGMLLFAFVTNNPAVLAMSAPDQQADQGILFYNGICGAPNSSNNTATQPAAAPAANADPDGWTYPTTADSPITSDYKSASRPGHRGVDLGNVRNTPIYASRDGVVVEAGPAQGFGNWIIIQHEENGQRVDSVYGHMFDDGMYVQAGQKVTAGQPIGGMGENGQSFGVHLHYEEWNGGRYAGSERKPVAVYGGNTAPANPQNQNAASATPQPTPPTTEQCCASPQSGGAYTPPPGESPALTVWNYLKGQGLTDEQVAGVMGNLAHESGDPTFVKATDSEEIGGGGGFGLMQWTGSRRTTIEQTAANSGRSLTDLMFQLEYMVEESKGRTAKNGGNEWEELTKQKTLEEATFYWMDNAERPGILHFDRRLEHAEKYLQEFAGKTGGAPSAAKCYANAQGQGSVQAQ